MRQPKPPALGHWRSGVREHASLPAMLAHLMDTTNRTRLDVAKGVGVDESTIRNWLSGKTTPPAADLARLATLFGCTLMVTPS